MIARTNVCRQAWQNHDRVSEWAKERREWKNERTNGRTDGRTDGWVDKWINNFARCLSRGPFLESPGNLSGPKSNIQMKI